MITKLNQTLVAVFCFYGSILFSQSTTITLDVSSSVGDAQIRSGSTSTNYGTLNSSNVSVASATDRYRFLLHFDLSSIPSNAVIHSASLQLTPTSIGEGGATTNSFVLNARTVTWNESTVNYTTGNSTITTNQQTTSSLVSGKRTFDLKNMVQAHVNGTQVITGFSIRRNPESTVTGACQYHTKESSTPANKPKLVITYYIPFSITAAIIQKSSTTSISSGTGSISPTISGGSGSTQFQWINSAGTQVATTQNLTAQPYGWYGLRLMGTLGDVFYMSFLIGVTCEPVIINFRQDPNFIDDANLSSNAFPATTNFGNDVNIRMGFEDPTTRTSLLRYRLWMDPTNDFLEAKLNLYGRAHTMPNNQSTISRLTSTWTELGVNNTNVPSFATDMNKTLTSTTTATENKIVDVTDYFRFWTNNSSMHHGFRFSGPGSGTLQDYHSSDATTSTNRPFVSFIVDDRDCDRTSFVLFKPKQDAALVPTYKGQLKVYFIEEYQQPSSKKWPLKLYNSDKVLIAAIDYNGNAIGGLPLLPSVNYVFSDNRATLNFNSLGLTTNAIYLLELTKSTGETEYVEFIFKP